MLFPTSGQPAGTVVAANGSSLHVAASGSQPGSSVFGGADHGLVGITLEEAYHGTLPTIAYSVLSDVVDSTGVARRLYTRSTLQVTVVGGEIVATDDHVTVRSGKTASLPGASNDNPAPGFFPFDFDEMGFPSTGQPPAATSRTTRTATTTSTRWSSRAKACGGSAGAAYLSFKPEAGFVGTTCSPRSTRSSTSPSCTSRPPPRR